MGKCGAEPPDMPIRTPGLSVAADRSICNNSSKSPRRGTRSDGILPLCKQNNNKVHKCTRCHMRTLTHAHSSRKTAVVLSQVGESIGRNVNCPPPPFRRCARAQ